MPIYWADNTWSKQPISLDRSIDNRPESLPNHVLSPSNYRDLISGRRKGVRAAMLRSALGAVAVPYRWTVEWRNRRYDSGSAAVHRAGVPVISVGNLTLGGTGKSPMVEWLARWFLERGQKVGILSRGYGSQTGPNDEARELAWKLPDVPHLQNPDRVAAARQAIVRHGCQVLVLDDGFQHRRIGRDLDIVLLDALEPFGFERIFPQGTLREPIKNLARADAIALSRADLLPMEQRQAIRDRVLALAPHALWLEIAHTPQTLLGQPSAAEQPLDSLRQRRILAFCGLGNPAGFRHTLQRCGYEVAEFREFPDHHLYTVADLESLAASARQRDVFAVVCTQKDLVKISVANLGDRPLWAVKIGTEILAGRSELERELKSCIANAPPSGAHGSVFPPPLNC